MSCGNSEDSSYRGKLTNKPTSQKVKKPKNDKPTPKNDNKILVYSVTGDWTINYGSKEEPNYNNDYCTYEIFYTKSAHKYELVMEGFQPKNHSAYEEISKLIININNAVLDGDTHKEIRTKYLQE